MPRTSKKSRPQSVTDLPALLTVEEFMKATRVKRTAAYSLVREGAIPVIRFGRAIRIPREVLLTPANAAR